MPHTTLIRPEIRALTAYHVPPAAGLIKLDAMENPYPLPDELREAWLTALRDVPLNRYPDPRAQALIDTLRGALQLPTTAAVLLGNGSDELIQMLALALANSERTVLALEPGFVMYRMIALFAGLQYVGVPLRAADFAIDLELTLETIARVKPVLTFIAYPNNPTGNLFDTAAIEQIITASPGLVVIDEAYAPFTDASFIHQFSRWPNVLVLRTVSKMGLAGLRLGYLIGAPEWINEIDKTRLPYNINVLTQVSAIFALQHKAVFDAQTAQIRRDRDQLYASLANLPNVRVYPSEANFLLLKVPSGRARAVFDGLKQRGLLIKNLDGAHPFLTDHVRITVGTADENAQCIAALRVLLA
ncbi:histidinol-phosphate transaminase [Thiospirillum jenense]|uniref:Histidinol-phosphate aminotransferase n=1 Tax=Thiospirillum jenense TaxID=1653858 RepID=A0A839HEE6_9GAMM|nr:histidinol-phosphate transaminase [Thiospirillum jenense]MBB1127031.1 histidinol-phosphate transaminase [Thiospirillum jenense]